MKPHHIYLRLLLSLFCLLTLLGCASLPTLKDMVSEPVGTPKPPTMTGPRGQLSPRESRAITDHINFATYIFEDDEVGRRFADLLLQKQSEGVQVERGRWGKGEMTFDNTTPRMREE